MKAKEMFKIVEGANFLSEMMGEGNRPFKIAVEVSPNRSEGETFKLKCCDGSEDFQYWNEFAAAAVDLGEDVCRMIGKSDLQFLDGSAVLIEEGVSRLIRFDFAEDL